MNEKETPKEYQPQRTEDILDKNSPAYQSLNNVPPELHKIFESSGASPQLNGSQPASTPSSIQASPPSSVPSPQIAAQSSPAGIASPKAGVPASPLARAPTSAVAGSPSATTPQQPIHSPINAASPQVLTPQTQKSSPQIIAARPAPVSQSPQNTQSMIPNQVQPTSTPQQAASGGNSGSAPSSMTLLDNLTATLSSDRKESFIALFRQLQNNAVTANQFLAQARMLLDQTQYQQLENLKSKPKQQPQRQIQPQQVPMMPNKNIKRPMDTSQIRAEDAQRAMSGISAPQAKRSRAADIPTQPLYRTTPIQHHALLQQNQQLLLQNNQLTPQQQQEVMRQHFMLLQQQQHLQNQQAELVQVQAQPQQSQQSPAQNVDKSATINTPTKVEEEDSSSITQDFMNKEMLTEVIKKIATNDGLTIGSDVVTIIALATQQRMQHLIHLMIEASKHRVDSQTFTQPPPDEQGNLPFKIVDVQDIKKQLLAIERVEREAERKRKEVILERERKAQLGEESHEGGGEEGESGGKPAKKKKKKDPGPGVSARNMSDDVRSKTTNETALMIAGGKNMPSWATGASTSFSAPIKEKPLSRQNSVGLKIEDTPAKLPSFANSSSSSSAVVLASPGTPSASSPTSTNFVDANTLDDQQPRGRGRPRRRKSGSGPDLIGKKSNKGFIGSRVGQEGGGFFLPPSTIGRPNRLGEQGARKVTVRDALFVLEDEFENKQESARRTLLKTYSAYLK